MLSLGVRLFAIDLDLIFAANPFLLLDDPALAELDFFVQSEGGNQTYSTLEAHVNIGFYCLAPTAPARRLVRESDGFPSSTHIYPGTLPPRQADWRGRSPGDAVLAFGGP